jgi:hypothetical protein
VVAGGRIERVTVTRYAMVVAWATVGDEQRGERGCG